MLSTVSVIIIDDQEIARFGIKQILQDHPNINNIYEASSGEEAINLAKEVTLDIALIDLKMPDMNGMETAKKLLEAKPTLKILLVTASIDELILPQLFKIGILGYFNKSGDPADIIQAIKTIQSGQQYISKLASIQMQRMTDSPDTEFSIFDTLSERELQTVLMIIKGRSVKDIGKKLDVDTKTVNSYRARAFQKLIIENDVELALLSKRRRLLMDQHEEQ
jgi:two-component system invasion response regulator UvrY